MSTRGQRGWGWRGQADRASGNLPEERGFTKLAADSGGWLATETQIKGAQEKSWAFIHWLLQWAPGLWIPGDTISLARQYRLVVRHRLPFSPGPASSERCNLEQVM